MATVLLAGNDATPCLALRKLAEALKGRGHTVIPHLLHNDAPNGTPFSPPSDFVLEREMRRSDIVVSGMSSAGKAYIDLRAVHFASAYDKPYGFFADLHGAYARGQFEHYRRNASFLFTVSKSEAQRAKELFPNAMRFPTGNPLWAPFFLPTDRTASRDLVNAAPEDFVILVPGTKDLEHNLTFLDATINAASRVNRARIVYTVHPGGDRNEIAPYFERIAHAEKLGLGAHGLIVIDKKGGDSRETGDLIAGADAVVNGRSVQINTLAQKRPAIDYYAPGHSQEWLKKETGSDRGYFFGSGAVIDIYDGDVVRLRDAFISLQNNPLRLVQHQLNALTPVDETRALERMCNALDIVLAKRQHAAA